MQIVIIATLTAIVLVATGCANCESDYRNNAMIAANESVKVCGSYGQTAIGAYYEPNGGAWLALCKANTKDGIITHAIPNN